MQQQQQHQHFHWNHSHTYHIQGTHFPAFIWMKIGKHVFHMQFCVTFTLHARLISTRKISNSLVAVYGVRHTTTFQMRDGSNISISGLDDTHISVLDLCIWKKIQCYARSCSPSVVYRYLFVHTEGIEIGTAIVGEYKQQNRKKTLMLI